MQMIEKRAILLAIALAIGAFMLYAFTAAPDLALADSGYLALACIKGGVAHPPGFPLYLIIGRFFSLVPFITSIYALNLMSAFFASLAVSAVFLAVERMLALIELGRTNRRSRRYGSAIAAALVFMTSRTLWIWSGINEVYALNVFLLTGAWACAWTAVFTIFMAKKKEPVVQQNLWGKKELKKQNECSFSIPQSCWRWIYATCAFAALGLANHHATAALIFPVLLLMVILSAPRLLTKKRLYIAALVCMFGALSLYLYLPIAAQNDPALNWGGIDNLSLLIRHATGQQYQFNIAAGGAVQITKEFFHLLFFGCGIPATILIIVGLILSFRSMESKRMYWLIVGTPIFMIVLNLILSTHYIAVQEDRLSYDLPATVAWCLLLGIGLWFSLDFIKKVPVIPFIVCVLIFLMTWNLYQNFKICNLRNEKVARTFVKETLDPLPKNSIVFTVEWNLYAPYLYMRHVENYRPDLHVIDLLMMRRFWYAKYLENAMPHLIEESRKEFTTFKEQVTRFDLGLPYDHANIQGFYEALLLRWIEIGQKKAGVYLDLASILDAQEWPWIKKYQTNLEGLLFRLGQWEDSSKIISISPKDGENLRYLRSKITKATLRGDPSDLFSRHHCYRKVWLNYQNAVETSLFIAAQKDNEKAFQRLIEQYTKWYPEIDLAIKVIQEQMAE